jgi:HPt (histidine-containing phosphotransfer) domain-containing protein
MSAPDRIPPVLDRAAFTELGTILPHDKVRELVVLFAAETGFYMMEMASRRAEGDLQSVARLARNIVSIAGNLGATRAVALARQLERLCRSGDKANTYHLISEMSQACRDASEEMDALLPQEDGSLHTAQT